MKTNIDKYDKYFNNRKILEIMVFKKVIICVPQYFSNKYTNIELENNIFISDK